MILGSVVHDGNAALATHLTNRSDNDSVELDTGVLVSDDAHGALAELRRLAGGARTRKPLLHVWASPAREYTDEEWDCLWSAYETEFDLEGQPHFEVTHRKMSAGGRTARHRHRVYLRVRVDGRAILMGHSAARNEKVSRIAEIRNGEKITPGVFTTAVIKHLKADGMFDVASALENAGGHLLQRNTTISAAERAEQGRTSDMPVDVVGSLLLRVLSSGASGLDLASSLAAAGLQVVRGDRAVGVLTPGGRFHALARTHNRAAKVHGLPSLKAAEVEARFTGYFLPDMGAVTVPLAKNHRPKVGKDRRARAAASKVAEEGEGKGPVFLPAKAISLASSPAAEGVAPKSESDRPVALDLTLLNAHQRAAIEGWRNKLFAVRTLDGDGDEEPVWIASVTQIDDPGKIPPAFRYKARLSSLPAEVGMLIRRVERQDAGITVHLDDGSTVLLEDDRARADTETPDALAVMIAHAKARGWSKTIVRGTSASCRAALARGLVRAGLAPEGDKVVEEAALDERHLIACEVAIQSWLSARRLFPAGGTSGPDIECMPDMLAATEALLDNLRAKAMLSDGQIANLKADDHLLRELAAGSSSDPGWDGQSHPAPPIKPRK